MIDFNYKKIICVITIALIFISAFVATGTNAQVNTTIPPDGGDPDINITALVRGCGNGIIEADLGEQCEGPRNSLPLDLGGQTCNSLGFGNGGVLNCRMSCIFDTQDCNMAGGIRIRDVGDVFNTNVPETNVVFTGQGEPGSTFFIIANENYLVSVPVDVNGDFSLTVSEPLPGEYNFKFYTISSHGLFGPYLFSTPIQQYATTYINNIFIAYDIKFLEKILTVPEKTIFEENPIKKINQPIPSSSGTTFVNPDSSGISEDVFRQFLDVLSQNESLSEEELRTLIQVFADQSGYDVSIPKYRDSIFKQTKTWLSQKTDGLSEWYPNVYISFMVPYWDFAYDLTDWFNKYQDPVGFHNRVRSWFK